MRDLHRSKTGVRREAELSWAAPSAFGFAGRAARAGLRRIARPLTWRQQIVDATLAGGLSELQTLAALDALAADAPVSDGVVMAETDVGRLLLHVEDKVMTPLIQRDHFWEAPEGRFLRSVIHPGAVVLDIGANVGYMTLLAARAAGPDGLVIAVEPERANAGLLRANVWLNGFANVRVIPVAAWSRRELLPLSFNTENRGDHQVGADVGEENQPSTRARTRPGRQHSGCGTVSPRVLQSLRGRTLRVDLHDVDHELAEEFVQRCGRHERGWLHEGLHPPRSYAAIAIGGSTLRCFTRAA